MLIILIFLFCFLPVSIVECSPSRCLASWKDEHKARLDKLAITFHARRTFMGEVFAFKGIKDETVKLWIKNAAQYCHCIIVNYNHKVAGGCSIWNS